MADEGKPADSATAPAGTQTGSPAATAAPAVDTSQVERQRLQAELGIERKRREEAQRAFHASQAQLKALQSQQNGYQETSSGSGLPPEVLAEMLDTFGYVSAARVAPDLHEYAPEINEILSDPVRLERYADPNPKNVYLGIYRDAKETKRAAADAAKDAEIAELKRQLEARSDGRETLKTHAVSSGVQSVETHEAMTRDDLEKMTQAEMEAKFGKAALLGNLVR